MNMQSMDHAQIRNFKDFLLLYNQISETCFRRCASNFLSRDITSDEELCIKNCAEKHIHANHRIMEVFMEVQPVMIRKRIEESNQLQAALETQLQKEQDPQQQVQPQMEHETEKQTPQDV